MAAPRFRVRVVLDCLAASRPGSVVDLGCGGGNLIREVRARIPGVHAVGIDLSEPQIDANRAHQPDVEWHAANLDERSELAPALRDRFDAVVAMEVIEHLDDPDALLGTSLRLARPGGGVLVLSTQSGPMRETERRVGHRRHFTAAELHAMLERSGWVPERVWNAGWPFHDLSKWYANRDPDASMSRFADRAYGARERAVCWALRGLFRLNSGRRGAQLFAVARRP